MQQMKFGIVHWTMNPFIGDNLSTREEIYTQLEVDDRLWSIKLLFDDSPIKEGLETMVLVSFLVESAPHYILRKGFIFDILDGATKKGYCEII